jgi:hypothetical protein
MFVKLERAESKAKLAALTVSVGSIDSAIVARMALKVAFWALRCPSDRSSWRWVATCSMGGSPSCARSRPRLRMSKRAWPQSAMSTKAAACSAADGFWLGWLGAAADCRESSA